MLDRIRPRLNHATIVAYVALFVALGGSSYSAVKISGKDIKNNSIAGKKLKNRTITRRKVKKNTLTGTEIKESRLGIVPNARRLNGVAAADFLTRPVTPAKFGTIPGARAFHSTAQSIPNDTLTTVALNSEAFDTASLHSTTTNNSRLTAPVSGLYSITAAASWFVNPTGFRTAQVRRNGSTIVVSDDVLPGDNDHVISTLARLSAGDYVELKVKQTSGAPLLLATGPQGETPLLTMHWVAPG